MEAQKFVTQVTRLETCQGRISEKNYSIIAIMHCCFAAIQSM
jgi:hypothetical protein